LDGLFLDFVQVFLTDVYRAFIQSGRMVCPHERARQRLRHAGRLGVAGRPVFVRTASLRTKLARVFVLLWR